MRRIVVGMLLSGLLAVLTAPLSASEMRGLWVDSWHEGFWTPEQTTAMVDKAKACNINALFVQVRKRGNVFYRSKIEPMSKDVAPDYDPLADVITKAHAAGIQVHAWLVTYQVFPDNERDTPNAPDRIHVLHPEWLMVNSQGKTQFADNAMYLDPGMSEVQTYIVSLVEELAKNYEIDGIHFDRVIYPRRDSGYNKASVARFNSEMKREGAPKPDDKDWCEWRINQVSQLMRSSSQALKRYRPKALLSASVPSNPKDTRWNHLQDWPSWLEQGCMDFVAPMLFLKDNNLFSTLLPDLLSAGKGKPVYVGVGAWQIPVNQALKQISAAKAAGAKGVIIYNYNSCSEPGSGEKLSFLDALRSGVAAEPADATGAAAKSQ